MDDAVGRAGIELERDVLLLRERHQHAFGHLDRRRGGDGPEPVRDVTGLQSAERDEIVDQVHEDPLADRDPVQHARLIVRERLRLAGLQQVHVSGDRLQRRAQLVAHPGDELHLGLRGPGDLRAGAFGSHLIVRVGEGRGEEARALARESGRLAAGAGSGAIEDREDAERLARRSKEGQDLGVPEAELACPRRPGVAVLPDVAHPHEPMLGERLGERSVTVALGPEPIAL